MFGIENDERSICSLFTGGSNIFCYIIFYEEELFAEIQDEIQAQKNSIAFLSIDKNCSK